MKVERVSCDVITPSAARGILEAVYWKPQMQWIVDRLHVLAPIQLTSIRRNEIACKIPRRTVESVLKTGRGSLGIAVEDHRQQRAAMILRDVCYGIDAHVEVIDPSEKDGTALEAPAAKHLESFKRRAERGQYFHHPYLGPKQVYLESLMADAQGVASRRSTEPRFAHLKASVRVDRSPKGGCWWG